MIGDERPHPGEHLAPPLVSVEAEAVPDRADERLDVGTLRGDAVGAGRGAVPGVEDGVSGSVVAEPFEAGQPRPVVVIGQVGVQVRTERRATGGQGVYFSTMSPTRGSAASMCLMALPRTLPYALMTVGRPEAAARASVTDSRASDTSSPRLAR